MNNLGKGIGIGLTACAIAYVAVQLNNPYVCWAFLVVAGMSADWKIKG